jgi:hypothetical protein
MSVLRYSAGREQVVDDVNHLFEADQISPDSKLTWEKRMQNKSQQNQSFVVLSDQELDYVSGGTNTNPHGAVLYTADYIQNGSGYIIRPGQGTMRDPNGGPK